MRKLRTIDNVEFTVMSMLEYCCKVESRTMIDDFIARQHFNEYGVVFLDKNRKPINNPYLVRECLTVFNTLGRPRT